VFLKSGLTDRNNKPLIGGNSTFAYERSDYGEAKVFRQNHKFIAGVGADYIVK
jgi:hypothetical protein